jgi:hypothetical protein
MHELAAGGGVFAAMVVATLTVGLGGAVGWWLRKLIAPQGAATTPSELGRSWAGWIVFVSSFTMLARFFGKLDVNSFAAWLGGGGVWAIVAYALGWAYGNFFKFKNGSFTAPPTAATSSGFASSAAVDSVRARPVTQPHVHTASASRTAAADAIPPIDPMVVDEDAIYAAIANELKTGATNEGLWTRLFAECDGDENRTKVAYIKQRAENLIAAEQARLATVNMMQRDEEAAHFEKVRLAGLSLRVQLAASNLSAELKEKLSTLSGSQLAAEFRNKVRTDQLKDVESMLRDNPLLVATIDNDDKTPLHLAVCEQHVLMCELLLENGAATDVKTVLGTTPLDFALRNGNQVIVKMLSAIT